MEVEEEIKASDLVEKKDIPEEMIKINKEKKSEKTESEDIFEFIEENYISIFKFINDHQDKIQNAKIVHFDFKQIPPEKYLLLITTHETNADLHKIDRPDNLYIRKIKLEKIIVVNSGICINGTDSRIYVGKSSVIQFHLLPDGNVDYISIIKKCPKINSENVIIIKAESKEASVDELKIVCKSITSKMYTLVKDLKDKKKIKETILDFMDKLNDINYLIKINNEFLAKYKF